MESFLHENHQHLGMADAEDVETVLRTTDSASLDAVLTYIVGRPAHFDSEVDNLMTQVMIARLAHDRPLLLLPLLLLPLLLLLMLLLLMLLVRW